MKKIIAIICVVLISLIVVYKISIHMFHDKISSILEYDKIKMDDFLREVQTGDIIQVTNRFNPRVFEYMVLGLVIGNFYMHTAMIIKGKDGVPYMVHMQLINDKQYRRLTPNINNNSGGIYIEKLEDFLKLYNKRYGSLFAWHRVIEKHRHCFRAQNILKILFSIKNIKYTSNREILYHIWRRAIGSKDKLPKRSAQCNIIIGHILEELRVFSKSDDIYAEYTPDLFDGLLDKCGVYDSMRQIKIIPTPRLSTQT
jgi:hypothetical protein